MGQLIFPTKVRWQRLVVEQEMDDDYRTPVMTRTELIASGVVPEEFETEAQVVFRTEGSNDPVFTGDDGDTSVKAVIDAATQRVRDIRNDDFIVAIFDQEAGIWRPYDLRVHEVRPFGQKGHGFMFHAVLCSEERKA